MNLFNIFDFMRTDKDTKINWGPVHRGSGGVDRGYKEGHRAHRKMRRKMQQASRKRNRAS